MINIKGLSLFSMLFWFFSTNAEVIDGPANFRIKSKGEILVSLIDGVNVQCNQLKQGWFEVSFIIDLTRDQYEKNHEIKKGDKLFDKKGKLIGLAISDIPTSSTITSTSGGAPGNPQIYWMEIIGYVSKNDVKSVSIPENVLNAVITKNRTNLKLESLKDFMVKNGYTPFGILKKYYPELKEFYISESTVGGGSALDRIRLIFDKNDLIAIVHSRPLKIDNVKDYDLRWGNRNNI